MKGSITLSGNPVPFDQIASLNNAGFTPFERLIVDFCREWLEGKATFELQTSGSTGVAKRIVIGREQMEASARATAHALHLQPGMRALLCLDPKYIAGKMMLVRSLVIGLDLVVIPPDSNPFAHLTQLGAFDFCAVVPYQLKSLLESDRRLIPISKLIVGGGEVDAVLEEALQPHDTEFYATYGMTETISHIALRRLNGPKRSSYYTALDGVALTKDSRGCLVVTAPAISTEPVISNDLVELIDERTFRWLGRADFVINSGGIKVIPERVEEFIRPLLVEQLGNVRFIVGGVPDGVLGQRVVLLIESDLLSEESIKNLLGKMKVVLGKYECPREIQCAPQFVLTPTGKVDRKATMATALPPPLSN